MSNGLSSEQTCQSLTLTSVFSNCPYDDLVSPFLVMVAGTGCSHHFEFDDTTQGARSWAGWKNLHYGNMQSLQVTALFPGWLTVKYSAHSFLSVSVCFSVKGVHDSTGSVLWWVGIG